MWALLLLFSYVSADETIHSYQESEPVVVWYARVNPENNPQESYPVSRFPMCFGDEKKTHRDLTFSENLALHEMVNSRIRMRFGEQVMSKELCNANLKRKGAMRMRDAIFRNSWITMYIDGLPVYGKLGFVGDEDSEGSHFDQFDEDVSLYTHMDFTISYNADRIINAQYTPSKPIKIYDGDSEKVTLTQVPVTYSVNWVATEDTFAARFDSYLEPEFFDGTIHWLSMLNSGVMVVFLIALVMIIVSRMMSKDHGKVAVEADELDTFDSGLSEVTGWKQITGEVFRSPKSLPLFTGLLASGQHLIAVTIIILIINLVGKVYESSGLLLSWLIVAYCLLGVYAGYCNGIYYAQNRGKNWIKSMLIGSLLFPMLIIGMESSLMMYSMLMNSSAAISIDAGSKIVALFVFIYLPLYIVGTLLGRNLAKDPSYPCKVNPVVSPILKQKTWYSEPGFLVIVGGLLPFANMSVETHFIFTAIWSYKIYYSFAFAAVQFVLLALALSCVSITVTYILLNSEDSRWAWVSFLSGGSTAVYFGFYSFFFYLFKTNMTGFFQLVYFFVYTGMLSLLVFLVCGVISYTASSYFVWAIYARVKLQ